MRLLTTFLCRLGDLVWRLVPKPEFEGKHVRRVLFMRECCLGDVLMSTPALRALRQALPGAEIDYMVGPWSRSMLEQNPSVDEVVPYVRLGELLRGGWKEFRRLRERRYDLVIVGEVGLAPIALAWLIGARYRAGFDAYRRGFLLTHKVPRGPDDGLHERVAYLEIVRSLGFEAPDGAMDLVLADDERDFAREWFESHGLKDNVVGFCPGGGVNPGTVMPVKRWPARRFAELADRLTDDFDVQVLLLGGPSDLPVVEQMGLCMRHTKVSAAGRVSVRESAALIDRCRLWIGNDCGPMHMAAALGTPTVSIFGPTDPKRLAPQGGQHRVVRSSSCGPCYQLILGTWPRCDTSKCMEEIGVEEAYQAAAELLASEEGRKRGSEQS